MNYAIIMAGGVGSRFWPFSRQAEPKQFLDMGQDKPLLEKTILRLRHLIAPKNIYLATNKTYRNKINELRKKSNISAKNILFEPMGKNTLAPIGVLARKIYDKDKDAVVMVFPSDHYVKNEKQFIKALKLAISVAKQGFIVTLGVAPDKPETGYGYIKINSKFKIKNSKAYKVERFTEKPELSKAKKLIKDRNYFWNTGIFIFRAKVILQEMKKFSPRNYDFITKIKDSESLKKFWKKLNSISIDYAIMEKTHKMALVPADFGWSDLGNWQSIECLFNKDRNGNILKGNCIDIGSKNILAWSGGRLLATLGLNDMVIVETKDVLLACAKDKVQEIKKLVQLLKSKKFKNKI